MRFLEVVVALAIKEFEQRLPKLTSRERRKINSRTHMSIHESVTRCVTWCLVSRGTVYVTLYGIVSETKYGRFTALNIPKCEHFTLLVCPLRFLVISAMKRLGNL